MAFAAPSIRSLLLPTETSFLEQVTRRILTPSIPGHQHTLRNVAIPTVIGAAASLGAFLESLWDSVLRAVPKKKTSYGKKRSRQLVGKSLKDIQALVACPSCGRPKRMHTVCAHCFLLVREMWSGKFDSFKPSILKKLDKARHVEASTIVDMIEDPPVQPEVEAKKS